jgi:hypothetical protein
VIRIIRARLPRGLQAFARREDGTVVVVVSAALPARQRSTAIRRALSAAPEAGWRSASSPVLLPALGGGLGAGRVPETRGGWALSIATAAVAATAMLAVPVTALSAGRDHVASPPGHQPSAARTARTTSGPGLAQLSPQAATSAGAQPGPGRRSASPLGRLSARQYPRHT